MSGELTGKVAIITGAGSGIGRANAILFAKAGAQVVACDRTPAAQETVAIVNHNGGRATSLTCDAGNESDVKALVDLALATYGGVDVFHANAGITGAAEHGIFDASAEDWLEVLRVNLVGPFLAIKHSAPLMNRRGGGSIICTASVAGLRAGAGPAQYSASKAGVINLVQSACQNLVGTNIRVNAICPGLIATAMTKPWYDEAGANIQLLTDQIPAQRGGEADEIAAAALFLASDASRYVNGQHLIVDGGLTSSIPTPWRPRAADVQAMLKAPG